MIAAPTLVRPLRPAEVLMLRLADGGWPLGMHAELAFDRHIDVERVTAAAAALPAHVPILGHRVVRTADGPVWARPARPAPVPVEVVAGGDTDCEEQVARLVSAGFPPDVPGRIRLAVLRGARRDRLVVVADHLACDGIGLALVVAVLAELYRTGSAGVLGPAPPDRPRPPTPGEVERLRAHLRAVTRGPAARPPELDGTGGDGSGGRAAGVVIESLSPAATAGVEAAGRQPGVTGNDLVVAALHLALGEMLGTTDRPVRVWVPASLRRRGDGATDPSNLVFPWPTATSAADRVTPSTTLEAVRAQGRALRRALRTGSLRTLAAAHDDRRVPPPWALRLLDVTSIASNVGRMDGLVDLGAGLSPVDGSISTVAPPPQNHSLTVVTYGGRLRLCCRYAADRVPPDPVRNLCRGIAEALCRLADVPSGRAPTAVASR